MNPTLDHFIFVVTNCREPGVAIGYDNALRRAGRRGSTWQRASVEDAVDFYKAITGRPCPPPPASNTDPTAK